MWIIVTKGSEQFGPFDIPQLQQYVDSGFFRLTDYCLADSWTEWKRLAFLVKRLPQQADTAIALAARTPKKNATQAAPAVIEKQFHSTVRIVPSYSTFIPVPPAAIGMERLTSLAALGFVESVVAGGLNTAELTASDEKIFHLARGAEIIGACTAAEIPAKIIRGELLPTDWWFDATTSDWLPVSEFEAHAPR
jgi:hypothetical protein